MALYTNKEIAFGDRDLSNQRTGSFTYSTTDINNAINSAGIPSTCKATKIITTVRMGKSYQLFDSKMNLTMSISSYRKTFTDVISNVLGNNDIKDGDLLCTSDNILSYTGTSNGRFNNSLNFESEKASATCYWKCRVRIYIDYETPETLTVTSSDTNKGTVSGGGKYYSGTTVTLTASPKTGYNVNYWTKNGTKISGSEGKTSISAVTEATSVTYQAVFQEKTYTITFNANGGTLPSGLSTLSPTYNSSNYLEWSALKNTSRKGYTLTGYYDASNGGNKIYDANGKYVSGTYWNSNGTWKYDGNVTAYAQWTVNKIKLTLDPTPGSGGTKNIWYYYNTSKFYSNEACTTQITAITRPTRTGYTFIHYYGNGTSGGDDGERYVAYDNTEFASDLAKDIYKDATLYAQWTPNKYTVTYNGNGSTSGSIGNTEHNYDDNSIVSNNANGFEKKYKITYNANYGNCDTETAWGIYELEKWNTKADGSGDSRAKGGAANNLATSGTTTLYAQWKGGAVTLPTPEREAEGYIFAGWYDSLYDGNLIGAGGATFKPTSNITLYAHWTAIPDIGYDNLFSLSNWVNSASGRLGGSKTDSDYMRVDNKQGTIRIVESDSSNVDIYTQYGIGNIYYHIPIESLDPNGQPITYYVKMHMKQNIVNSLGQFFVFYYTDTGNASTSHQGWRSNTLNESKDYTFSFTPPSNCTKIGLRFGTFSNLADVTFSNIRIYKGNSTYEKVISTIDEYKARDLKTLSKLYTPIKEGYTFNNWCKDSSLSSPISLSEAQSISKGITIYNNWTEHQYTINFDGGVGLGNATGNMPSITGIYYDTSITLPKNNFERIGYKFLGWSNAATHTNPSFYDMGTVQHLAGKTKNDDEITLYAIWEQLKYTIKWKNLDGTSSSSGEKIETNVLGGTWPKCLYDISKQHDEIYHYHFNNKWQPALQTVGGDPNIVIEYEAVFDAEEHKYHLTIIEPIDKKCGYDLHTCTVDSVCSYSYRDNPKWGITFLNGNGSNLEYLKLSPGVKPSCSKTPEKEPTIDSTFVLNKIEPWSPRIKVTPEADVYSDEPIEYGNMTYTPNFFRMDRYYTITFLDEEEKVILSQKKIKYGEKIYAPEPPDEDDDKDDATFFGWLEIRKDEKQIFWSEDTIVEKDVRYKAVYTRETKSYNVEWWRSEEDSEPICITQVLYGERPNFPFDIYGDPVHPLQGKDPKYNYIFLGWTNASDLDPEDQWQDNQNDPNDLPEITWHTKYVAVFGTEDIKYKVRWLNPKKDSDTDYELIYEEEINYGVKPVFDITKSENFTELAHPMQGEDPQFNYVFIGWKTSIYEPPITDDELEFQGEITYMAVYIKKYIEYSIKIYRFYGDDYLRDEDNKPKPEEYIRHYGDRLYPNALLNDIIGHNFSHWSNNQDGINELTRSEVLSIVVEDTAEYWAIYDKKEYQVRWLDYNCVQLGEYKTFKYKDNPLNPEPPEQKPQEPTRDYDDLYHYTFGKWLVWSGRTTSDGRILGDVSYIANYDRHEHPWKKTTYEFSENGKECTASRVCNFNHNGYIEEHSQSRKITTIPTIENGNDSGCETWGITTYVAIFKDDWNRKFPYDTYSIQDIEPKGHDYAPADSLGKNVEDGQHYIYCRRCDYNDIQSHNWQPIEDTEITSYAACLIGGRRKYRCQTFGCEGYYYEYIKPNGHNFTDDRRVKAVEETCTKPGNVAYKQCDDCLLFFPDNAGERAYGEKTNKSFLTPPLGHNYILDKDNTKKANCIEHGEAVKFCERKCGEPGNIIKIDIPPRGHDWAWQSTTTDATCTQEGEEIYYCQNTGSDRVTDLYKQCEEKPKEVVVPKTPHQPVIVYGYKPTCTKDGLSDGTKCRICDTELTLQYALPALGHKYVAKNVVPAENTLRREIIYGCTRKDCEHNYHIEYIK